MTPELPPASRATVYHLAARLVLREPDEALLRALRQPDVLAVLEQAAPGISAELYDWTPERAERADVAFAGLFLLPNGVPPRAEAWLGPGGIRPLRELVARALVALGRDVDHAQGRLPPDHAALLFELAAYLLQEGTPQEDLARELLAPWVAPFSAALSEAEAPLIYVALGRLLAALHPISLDPTP